MQKIKSLLKENLYFLLFIFLMVTFRTSVADWNSVPTGSMKPTIIEGDRIWVNKIAYDLNIPFTSIRIKKFADPKRGDIVIFDSARANKRLVKRVVAIPGDKISMVNNILYLNGKALSYKVINKQGNTITLEEQLAGVKHLIRLQLPIKNQLSNFMPIKVPGNAYLVLGDNRDNSADSRVIGFIPRSEIIGRARHVVMSLDYNNYYIPRSERFLKQL